MKVINNLKRFKIVMVCMMLLCMLILPSCKKFLEIDPPKDRLVENNVYETDATAAAVLTGVYQQMVNSGGFSSGINGISLLSGLSADEFVNYSNEATKEEFYTNSLKKETFTTYWGTLYRYIFTANSAIEGISASSGLTPAAKDQLQGEAKFIRAFCYFYLTNFFGRVPLLLSTNYEINSVAGRSSQDSVYQQIIADLTEAQALLSADYSGPNGNTVTSERIRPNKWAATALLARVYLYTNQWNKAEIAASDVINNKTVYDTVALDNVFLKGSKEAIWQLQSINEGYNTWDANVFILTSGPNPSYNIVSLSEHIVNAFEPNDQRVVKWIGTDSSTGDTYYYPFKYKANQITPPAPPSTTYDPPTEYLTVLRLAEQYLIRAEARIKQGKTAEGLEDLDIIRKRAGLPDYSGSTDPDDLEDAILHERQVELFTEWGHRWLDLKRTNKVNEVMNTVTVEKGGTWNNDWQWYPVPLNEINNNPNLTQNNSY